LFLTLSWRLDCCDCNACVSVWLPCWNRWILAR
jgi:hypothetical protein